jgi:hypothetical protein
MLKKIVKYLFSLPSGKSDGLSDDATRESPSLIFV